MNWTYLMLGFCCGFIIMRSVFEIKKCINNLENDQKKHFDFIDAKYKKLEDWYFECGKDILDLKSKIK